jgi:GGDEF domain-containing protein
MEAVHFIDRHDIYVTTSIGVSVYAGDGLDAETLIKNADTAMYYAKKSEKQGYKFFSTEMAVESEGAPLRGGVTFASEPGKEGRRVRGEGASS